MLHARSLLLSNVVLSAPFRRAFSTRWPILSTPLRLQRKSLNSCDRGIRRITVQSLQAPQPVAALSDVQLERIEHFIDFLLEENTKFNITAVRSKEEAMSRHVGDCLSLLPIIKLSPVAANSRPVSIIDVGSGGGLPGIILAIAEPSWKVTLLDSTKKKCNFMQAAIEEIGLSNAEAVWGRAEEVGRQQQHRQAYDVAVARAVADLAVLAELCLPLVRVGGQWVAAKGPNPEDEVQRAQRAISVVGGDAPVVHLVGSFSADGQRTAVSVKKVRATSNNYPRLPGVPNKTPL